MIQDLAAPSQMKSLLKKHDFHFKKSLGQNFLTDRHILEKIVKAADIGPDDLVLEVGPGAGVLTRYLAEKAKKVVAVELDRTLLPVLTESLADFSNVEIMQGDVLQVDLRQIMQEGSWKVVANLPYYITTPVIFRFLESKLPLKSLTVMVQKEVAERMAALPGGKDYGNLSVVVQYYSRPKIAVNVPKTVFLPQPEVDSAVINLAVYSEPVVEVKSEKDFFRVVKAAFSQRRKTLRNCLKNGLNLDKEKLETLFRLSGIDGTRRGETLSLADFASLANLLTKLAENNER